MSWLRRRRGWSGIPDESAAARALHSPPEVGTADYQNVVPLDPFDAGADTARWQAPDAPRPDAPREEPTMSDENPDNVSAGPYGGEDPNPADPRPVDLTDTGSHRYGGSEAPTVAQLVPPVPVTAYTDDNRADCPHCQGTGKVLTKSDLLRASLRLLGTDPRGHDAFVAEFYSRLFGRAEYLTAIFPPDLANPDSDPQGRGKAQRDKLLAAVLALGSTYDPSDRKAMEVLDQHLAMFGRSHSAFHFSDGARPPTIQEYALVKDVLMGLFHDATGDAWRPEYDAAWSEAYDYAYRKMADAGWEFLRERDGDVFPRTVRR